MGKYRSNVAKSSEYLFRDVAPDFIQRCNENKANNTLSAIVAGVSYGQGSSREHAALCPMYLGVRMVIAKGIERIHLANLVNFGIFPLAFTDPNDYDKLKSGDELLIDSLRQSISEETIIVKNVTRNYSFTVSHSLTPRQIKSMLD